MQVANGTADVTTYFVLRDSTNHAPKTDVTITDIDLYYCEQRAAMAAKVDATALAAADSAHADNKAFHVGQGLYRIDWPDEAFNGGVGKVVNLIVVCTGVDTTFLEVELTGVSQTGDAYAVVAHTDYGNAKLVRATTPANTLDVSATGEAGLDFANIKDATGAHTLMNITVPTVTTVGTTTNLTNLPAAAALEATLTDLKGAGYTNTTDTLEKIRDAIPAAAPSAADNATAVAAAILVTPANKLATDASGHVSISGTKNTLDSLSGADGDTLKDLSDEIAAIAVGAGLTAQEVRDAMKLAPTAGAPAAGSVDEHLDDILEDTGTTLPASIAALNNLSISQAQAAATAALNAYDPPTKAELDAADDAVLAVLTAIKGAGWTTETLVALDVLLDAIKVKTDALDTSAITVVSGICGTTLTLYHAATFDTTVSGLTIPADWTKVIATLKRADTDADTAALVQAQVSNPAGASDGLLRLNGVAAGAGEDAWSTLTVDQPGGSVRWQVHQPATAQLKPRAARWDLKVLTADSPVEGTPLVVSSPLNVVYTTTRSTS